MRPLGPVSQRVILACLLVLALFTAVGGGAFASTPSAAKVAADAKDITCPGLGGPDCAYNDFGYAYPNAAGGALPPDCDERKGYYDGCFVDSRGFYWGQCTSWVAFRVDSFNNFNFNNSYLSRGPKDIWGDAANWGTYAQGHGIPVSWVPQVGTVAWWPGIDHVGYVEQVNSTSSIVVSEMNRDLHDGFLVHTITAGTKAWPAGFIYLNLRSRWNPADVNHDGHVNIVDLGIVLRQYGRSVSAPATLQGDVNADLKVDGSDLSLLLANWGH